MKEAKNPDLRTSRLIAGRTFDEQIEFINKYGNHGITSLLKVQVLKAFGIPEPRKNAENLIVFGCYPPFSYGFVLRDYIKILNLLEIEYTYLEKEFCCGSPLISMSTGREKERAIETGKRFVQRNLNMAQQKGAKAMVYCCVGCVHVTKNFFPNHAGHHIYLLDLVIDKLAKEPLKMSAPTVVGYFEGCHSTYRAIAKVGLEWAKYRQLLDRIESLKVVDLPNNNCCRKYPEDIIEAAEKHNLDTIVCPCNGCLIRLGDQADGRVHVKHFTEIALEGLTVGRQMRG